MTEPNRTATPPAKGAARDALIGWALLSVTAYVTAQTGSEELGNVAGQITGSLVEGLWGLALGGVTYLRKRVQDHTAALGG